MNDREKSQGLIDFIKGLHDTENLHYSKIAKMIGAHPSSVFNWLKNPPKNFPRPDKVDGYRIALQNMLEGNEEVKYEVDYNSGIVMNVVESDICKLIYTLADKRDKAIKEMEHLKERLAQLERKEIRYRNAVEALRELEASCE